MKRNFSSLLLLALFLGHLAAKVSHRMIDTSNLLATQQQAVATAQLAKAVPKLSRHDVRKLLLQLRAKDPTAYKQVKTLPFTQQRKLFLEPILNALGLGSISSALGPLGTSLMGVGGVVAGVGLGALAGRMGQNNELSRLKQEKMKIDSELMMVKSQRDSDRAKFDFKLGELENQLADLNESAESGANLIGLWVDSHALI